MDKHIVILKADSWLWTASLAYCPAEYRRPPNQSPRLPFQHQPANIQKRPYPGLNENSSSPWGYIYMRDTEHRSQPTQSILHSSTRSYTSNHKIVFTSILVTCISSYLLLIHNAVAEISLRANRILENPHRWHLPPCLLFPFYTRSILIPTMGRILKLKMYHQWVIKMMSRGEKKLKR